MSILREVAGAICCCLPVVPVPSRARFSHDLKRLSDWRAHPTLQQYQLEQHIADGGFSEVWLARHRTSGEEQVLKVVNLRKPGLKPEDAEVLRGEARLLRNLDHPGLLRCRDVFETKYHLVMILEYLSGGEMLEHLHKVAYYSEAEAARLFAQVVSALAYLHNLNIVHRDIKPENVMFARRVEDCLAARRPLRVKLIDLGMAAVLLPQRDEPDAVGDVWSSDQDGAHRPRGGPAGKEALLGGCSSSGSAAGRPAGAQSAGKQRPGLGQAQGLQVRTRRGTGRSAAAAAHPSRPAPRGCLGSPGFIAPEVVNGGPHTFAMDVYSLGVLLFVMLTGRKPWPLRDVRDLSYAQKPLSSAPGLKDSSFLDLSPAAQELLLAMLADDPRDRPTCTAVLRHPFIVRALAEGPGAAAGGTAGLQQVLPPPLDEAIKRRIAALASLRRFRGLSFAMMSSPREGQQMGEFLDFVLQRRKALHRDIVSRARVRRSIDRLASQHLTPHTAAKQVGGQEVQLTSVPAADVLGNGSTHATPMTATSHLANGRHLLGPAAPTSTDSTSSQQPLLPPGSSSRLLKPSAGLAAGDLSGSRPSYDSVASASSVTSVSSQQPLLACDGRVCTGAGLPSHHPAHHFQPHALDASAPLPAVWRHTSGHLGAPVAGGPAGHPNRMPPHHPNPVPHTTLRGHFPHSHLEPVAEPGEASASDAFAQPRPQCPKPMAVTSTAAVAAQQPSWPPPLPPPLPEAARPTTAACQPRSGGWSSSGVKTGPSPAALQPQAGGRGRPHAATVAEPPQLQAPRPQRRTGTAAAGLSRRSRGSELELAALDPLALIRELPGGPGRTPLGRSHSAPESRRVLGCDGRSGGGGSGGGGLADVGSGGGQLGGGGDDAGRMESAGAATWLEQLAMGADMRALSANSWTLDLLANQELLAALTGMNLDPRRSSSGGDGTVYDNSVYDGSVGTSNRSVGRGQSAFLAPAQGLPAVPGPADSAAPLQGGVSDDGKAAAVAAAAAAAAAAFRRLQTDISNRGGKRTSSAALEATVHAASQAAALLAAVSGDQRSREGWPSAGSPAAGRTAAVRAGGAADAAAATATATTAASTTPSRSAAAPAQDVAVGDSVSVAADAGGVYLNLSGLSPFRTPGSWMPWGPGTDGAAGRGSTAAVVAMGSGGGSGGMLVPGASPGSGASVHGSRHLAQAALYAQSRWSPFRPFGQQEGSGSGGLGSAGSASGVMPAVPAAAEGQPMLLLRAARYGSPDELGRLYDGGLYGSSAFSPLPLRVAAARQLSGSAAAAAMALSPETAACADTTSCSSLEEALAAAAAPPPPRRPPSLALLDVDEHIAARMASLEETMHGGDAWFRGLTGAASGLCRWSTPTASLPAPPPATAAALGARTVVCGTAQGIPVAAADDGGEVGTGGTGARADVTAGAGAGARAGVRAGAGAGADASGASTLPGDGSRPAARFMSQAGRKAPVSGAAPAAVAVAVQVQTDDRPCRGAEAPGGPHQYGTSPPGPPPWHPPAGFGNSRGSTSSDRGRAVGQGAAAAGASAVATSECLVSQPREVGDAPADGRPAASHVGASSRLSGLGGTAPHAVWGAAADVGAGAVGVTVSKSSSTRWRSPFEAYAAAPMVELEAVSSGASGARGVGAAADTRRRGSHSGVRGAGSGR